MNWIDVKKKLPEKLGNGMAMTRCVLVTVSDGGDPYYGETLGVTEAFYRFDTERWFNAGSGLLVKTVTHWQPMPPAAGG